MAEGVKVKKGEDFTCECGAVYAVEWTTSPFPDTDSANCESCGRKIKAWNNATTWPSYTRKK